MYHGDDSGHLILFVNAEIILIDFNKKTEHTYSFYIENQLIKFEIKEKDDEYEYIVTPQPLPPYRPEEKYFDKHFWIPLIILILAINLIFYFFKSF